MSNPSLKITIVVENSVGRPLPLLGEHGFACLVDCAAGRLLFDTGRGSALLHNLNILEIDPASIDAVVLSHGHDDHTGGLMPLLRKIGARPVYAHPEIFSERYFARGGEIRPIGLASSRSELEAAGARFRLIEECTELAHGLWFSGEIPRRNAVEHGDLALVVPVAGSWETDPFADDAALAVTTAAGLVILLGCAHAGVINTVEHFRRQLGESRIHAVIGGMHLAPVSDGQYQATESYFAAREYSSTRLGLCHCTGLERAATLHARFPGRVSFASVGTTYTF